jgi:hypothetical protein
VTNEQSAASAQWFCRPELVEEVAERATPHALVTQGLRVPQQGKIVSD